MTRRPEPPTVEGPAAATGSAALIMRFAEIINEVGKRLHIGCIMAAGQDWVEVSLPDRAELAPHLKVRFLPSPVSHEVNAAWRTRDRVGLTYVSGGPPEEHFAGLPGLFDPRPAAVKAQS